MLQMRAARTHIRHMSHVLSRKGMAAEAGPRYISGESPSRVNPKDGRILKSGHS
jgi:hypothetical protein